MISVLLPVHNGAATLPEALASLAAQSCRDFELVLVDDGSTDGSADLARRMWPAVRVLAPGRVGLVAALNLGLDACRAPLVARMDADDVAEPTRLQRQLELMRAEPDVAISATLIESTGAGEGFRLYDAWMNALVTHDAIVRERFIESPLAHPSVMFRRDAVQALGGYRDAGWPEDYDLWLRAAAAGLRFAKVPEVLLRWRDHAGRQTRTHARYTAAAHLRCKAHHLARELAGRPAVLWGGAVASKLAALLGSEGAEVVAFVDVDPKKIGGTRRGLPVLAPAGLSQHRDALVIAAVGTRGARELIRAEALRLGRIEGADFLCAA